MKTDAQVQARMSGFLLKFDGSPKTLVVTFQASFAGLFGSPVYA